MSRYMSMRRFSALFKKTPKFVYLILCVVGFLLIVHILSIGDTPTPPSSNDNNVSLRTLQCKHSEPINVIHHLCSLFQKKRITGNICEDICQKENIVFKKCLSNRDGKYALLVDCVNSCIGEKTVPAVIKMYHINASDVNEFLQNIDKQIHQQFSFIKVFNNKIHVIDQLVSQDTIAETLTRQLFSEYGVTPTGDQNLHSFLWNVKNQDLHENSHENAVSILLVRSLWSLMSQSEYRVSTLFKDLAVFPKIHGFCGPLYLSEYAPYDIRLDRRSQVKANSNRPANVTWRERVNKTMKIFKLLQLADSLQTPVHFCDVKLPHFGTAEDGSIRFTDADTIFTDQTLRRDLGSPLCRDHQDCAFFDCESWCFKDQGTCSPVRTNNNLQVTCAKILRDQKASVYEGILSNPPSSVASELQSLLDSCADKVSSYIDGIPMKRPGLDVLFQIQSLLMKSLDDVHQ